MKKSKAKDHIYEFKRIEGNLYRDDYNKPIGFYQRMSDKPEYIWELQINLFDMGMPFQHWQGRYGSCKSAEDCMIALTSEAIKKVAEVTKVIDRIKAAKAVEGNVSNRNMNLYKYRFRTTKWGLYRGDTQRQIGYVKGNRYSLVVPIINIGNKSIKSVATAKKELMKAAERLKNDVTDHIHIENFLEDDTKF